MRLENIHFPSPEVDGEYLSGLVGSPGNADLTLLQGLLEAFREESTGSLERMEAATEEDLAETVGREAHSLAGSSSNLGLARLASVARQIMHLVEAGDPSRETLEAAASCLRSEYLRGLDKLATLYRLS